MNLTLTIEFNNARCFNCGRYWAYEDRFSPTSPTCPFCAQKRIENADKKADAAERRSRSLSGVITRLKARK